MAPALVYAKLLAAQPQPAWELLRVTRLKPEAHPLGEKLLTMPRAMAVAAELLLFMISPCALLLCRKWTYQNVLYL